MRYCSLYKNKNQFTIFSTPPIILNNILIRLLLLLRLLFLCLAICNLALNFINALLLLFLDKILFLLKFLGAFEEIALVEYINKDVGVEDIEDTIFLFLLKRSSLSFVLFLEINVSSSSNTSSQSDSKSDISQLNEESQIFPN